MLKITSDGRKIGLDQRLMNPLLPDDPGSKLNACVNNVLKIWEDGKDRKLTQLVFCDLSSSVPFGADRRNDAADGRRRRTKVVIQQAEPMRLIDVLAPIIMSNFEKLLC